MSHVAESSRGGRARSRQVAHNNCIGSEVWDPVGELSGFPLIRCPDCGLAWIVEGRTKKDGDNHGRLYFKCARNAYPKLCGYYRFKKEYFQVLKDRGIIIVHPSNWAEMLMDEEVDGPNNADKNNLEQKLEDLTWKMNMFLLSVVFVVLGCVFMYVVKK